MKTQTSSPVSINPRRSIGGIYPQIVVEEQHSDELAITSFPVESGASINDHAFKLPETVTITAATSASEEDVNALYDKLLQLQESREPFEIVTGKRKYTDMLVEKLAVPTDKERENVLWFSATCMKIRIVGVKSASLAPRGNQSMPNSTEGVSDVGSKAPGSADSNSSALNSIFGK